MAFPGRMHAECSSRPRRQAREHASTVIRSYGPHFSHQASLRIGTSASDPHARVHRALTGSQHCYQHWQRDWSTDQGITVAQIRTGHSPLVAAYLRRIRRWNSAICPHCQGTGETVEHLVFQCLTHDQAKRETWLGDSFTTDPRRLWSYLERTGAGRDPDRK